MFQKANVFVYALESSLYCLDEARRSLALRVEHKKVLHKSGVSKLDLAKRLVSANTLAFSSNEYVLQNVLLSLY
jgi:hypothetical protein